MEYLQSKQADFNMPAMFAGLEDLFSTEKDLKD